jgi:hypothetical protein
MIGRLAVGLLLFAGGCNALEKLTTIELDEGEIPAVTFEHDYQLDLLPLAGCPVGRFEVPDGAGGTSVVTVERASPECLLVIVDDDTVIFSEEELRAHSNALDERAIESIERASVIVQELVLTGDAPLAVPGDVAGVELAFAGEFLFTREDLANLGTGAVEKELPPEIEDLLLNAVETESALVADTELRLAIPEEAVADLPARLHVRLVLQPVVVVNVFEVAL